MKLALDQKTLRRLALQLGLPGWVGVALLLLAAWGEWGSLPAWQRQIDQANAEARRIRQVAQQGGAGAQAQATPEQAVAALMARLPTPAQRSTVIAGILQAAKAQQLSIDSLQLHQTDDRVDGGASTRGGAGGGTNGGTSVSRQQIDLPIKGRYEQIRAWLVALLQEQPALSLDSLQLKRPDAQTDQIDARVSLSLWVFEGAEQRADTPGEVRK
jgi:Tfp pilus assembly protein PilO